jgi:hypothetical protein
MSTRASLGATRATMSRTARGKREKCRLGGKRLLEKIHCAEARGAHRISEPGPSAHHDDRHVGQLRAKFFERREAIHVPRHHQVEEHGVWFGVGGRGQAFRAVRCVPNLVAFGAKKRRDHAANVGLVVDQENVWH